MLTYLNQKRGQSTLEYAVLTVIIIGALLSIQFYIKRGVQGRLKSATDDIGDQYSVGNTNVIKTTKTSSTTQDTFGTAGQGVSKSQLVGPESTNTSENSAIINTEQEYMGR
jgi:cytoskeletal protein RodZ